MDGKGVADTMEETAKQMIIKVSMYIIILVLKASVAALLALR